MGPLFYKLIHHEYAGLHFLRWFQIDLLILAGAGALGWLPGGWMTGTVALVLFIGLGGGHRYWQAKEFLEFIPGEIPLITPATLPSSAKLSIWASGYFSVENKHRHFAWLQGFYRTFPSREHAVICLNPPTSLLYFGQSPASQAGMWYSFFKPEAVEEIRWGKICFGKECLPGLTIAHTVRIPRRNWFQPEKDALKTTYLAFPDRDDALAVLADLLYDRHAAEAASKRSMNGVAKKHPQDSWRTQHK